MISPGKILYKTYHQPIGYVKQLLKTGIKRNIQLEAGRKEMMAAAISLKEFVYPGANTYRVYFLTGKKYWYQTAFCLYSLQQKAGVNIQATIVDDGSFDDNLQSQVLRTFPSSVVVRKEEINTLLDEYLPQEKFPVLRQRRLEYPHLRKFTDIHIIQSAEPKLVLDSDMLFFHKPHALIEWFINPDKLLFMKDSEQSYGYSIGLMKQLSECNFIPERINVGVAGIPSERISWGRMEHWTAALLEREGSSYYQEQALAAMIAAKEPHLCLDAQSYKVLPQISNNQVPEILHHYVANTKYDYFTKGWRLVL